MHLNLNASLAFVALLNFSSRAFPCSLEELETLGPPLFSSVIQTFHICLKQIIFEVAFTFFSSLLLLFLSPLLLLHPKLNSLADANHHSLQRISFLLKDSLLLPLRTSLKH